jgi:hypothetical protein
MPNLSGGISGYFGNQGLCFHAPVTSNSGSTECSSDVIRGCRFLITIHCFNDFRPLWVKVCACSTSGYLAFLQPEDPEIYGWTSWFELGEEYAIDSCPSPFIQRPVPAMRTSIHTESARTVIPKRPASFSKIWRQYICRPLGEEF